MNENGSQPACAPPAHATAAARRAHTAVWFPERGGATREAEQTCRACPRRETCLKDAVTRHEPVGIWGGAGGSRLRLLRRELAVSESRYLEAAAAHFRALDGAALPQDRVTLRVATAAVTHGRRSSWSKGCRCGRCRMAAQMPDDVLARITEHALNRTTPAADAA